MADDEDEGMLEEQEDDVIEEEEESSSHDESEDDYVVGDPKPQLKVRLFIFLLRKVLLIYSYSASDS